MLGELVLEVVDGMEDGRVLFQEVDEGLRARLGSIVSELSRAVA